MGKTKIVVKNLYKVFGSNPNPAINLLSQGFDKDQIYQQTGLTVGVQDASFDVEEGEVFVVMGLSGSGKSTLVRMLNRLVEPTAGNVFIDGENIGKLSRKSLIALRRRDISMVFQSFALMPHLTILENAAYGLRVAGVKKARRQELAHDALEKVGLAANANSYPRELSGGMKQRVGLARALAANPSIMLMDEAFSALDPLIRTEMQDELLRLQEEEARTVIFISHDLDEALRIGDRIAIMEGGRVVQVGTPEDILKNPADDYVRAFFRGCDLSQVFTAKDIATRSQVTIIERPGGGARAALRMLRDHDRDLGVVIDRHRRYHGMVTVDSLIAAIDRYGPEASESRYEAAFLKDVSPVGGDTPFADVIVPVAESKWPLPVLDEAGHYLGTVSKTALLLTLDKTSDA